jgi:hypothetical protein
MHQSERPSLRHRRHIRNSRPRHPHFTHPPLLKTADGEKTKSKCVGYVWYWRNVYLPYPLPSTFSLPNIKTIYLRNGLVRV